MFFFAQNSRNIIIFPDESEFVMWRKFNITVAETSVPILCDELNWCPIDFNHRLNILFFEYKEFETMPLGHITKPNLRASSNLILGKAIVADYRL